MREKETVLDEKIVQRTEEVSDPITGEPTLQTFEYVEKTIEKEVSVNFFHFAFAKNNWNFFNYFVFAFVIVECLTCTVFQSSSLVFSLKQV